MIYGHGIDIVEVDRISKAINDHSRFIQKIFTPNEVEYCESRKSSIQSYAGRFAAKEAFLKALGTGRTGKIKSIDIEVINDDAGKPYIKLSGETLLLFKEKGLKSIILSISHEESYAIASVILEI